ncbi:conserved hypothetical protein [Methylobacterium sp. 4-46]|uniref:hypothetical protein n=1 Tax=unclassified Methylobacterium TaxID=2615210 RepID=UPI000152D74F|nr:MULTISPECIES: hypothetical protein [Methylobacterium]ACA19005.1 conserved hypothetical protein [Methylobacterium sp. 4-46]WFT78219.1 hypothetical protein QA634_23450 [Methylobacterium nodulans]
MSEPAYKTSSSPARQPAGPLRDWLATLSRIDGAAAPARAPERAEPELRRSTEAPAAWEPRIVSTPPAPAPAPAPEAPTEDEDIAALMAENMVLKARLKSEADRYEELQAIIAEELRALRHHVESEIKRTDELRAERDLWMARAEALAQPLFQKR